MRQRKLRWWYFAIAPSLSLLLASDLVTGKPNAWSNVSVHSVEFTDVTNDRIQFRVRLAGTADRDLTIRALLFDDVWLNGVPVFLPPLAGPARIAKGKRLDDIGALHATVFFRDLESLDPLRRMIREERAIVRATIRMQPGLNVLQRVALWSSNVWASTSLERIVPVRAPAGELGKQTLLLGLAAADRVWVLGRAGVAWRRERNDFLQQVRTGYAASVLAIETRYEIRSTDGQSATLYWYGLGFHVHKGRVLVPAEAVEPWMFEGRLADVIASNDAQIVKGSLNITVRPTFTSARNTYSLKAGEVKLVAVAQDRVKAISIDRKKVYPMRKRNSSANAAWLEIAALAASQRNVPELNDAPAKSALASSVAIFRLRSDAKPSRQIEVVLLPTTGENARVRLAEPVDSRAFGSPVIGPDGVLGMLQDQTGFVSMGELRKNLDTAITSVDTGTAKHTK